MTLQGDRLEGAQQAIAELSHPGGAPLIGRLANGSHVPVGLSDDPGWYVYDSYVSHWLGQSDPRVVLRWSYIVLFSLLIALLPIGFLALTGSWAAAVLAPIIAEFQFSFLENTDIYWLNGWVLLLLLPFVFATYRLRWSRWSRVGLVAAAVIASWVTSIRLHGGLPVALAAVVIVLLRERGRWRKLVMAAVVVLAYLSVFPLAYGPIFHARDAAAARLGLSPPGKSLSDIYPHTHLTWHNAYIGLGWLPNRFGIRWEDVIGYQHARRIDPHVILRSKRYDSDERTLFLRVLRSDPGLVWRNIELKTRFELGQALRRFGWALLVLPLIFGLGRRRRRELGVYLGLTVPALALTLAPPVLTVPILFYSVGFFAAAGFVWLLAATWFVGVTLPEVVGAVRAWRTRGETLWPISRRNALVLTGAGIAAAAALLVVAPPIEYGGFTYNAASGGSTTALSSSSGVSPLPALRGLHGARWTFAGQLPSGWTTATPSVDVQGAGGALAVTTEPQKLGYVLVGPVLVLKPGTYRLGLVGDVVRGGLDLGVLDAGKDVWIEQSGYSSSERLARRAMVTSFTLTTRERVQPILTNWRPTDGTSSWRLRELDLVRVRS